MSEVPGVLDAGEDTDESAPADPNPEEKGSMRTSEVVALVERAYDEVYGCADGERSPIWDSDSLLARSHRASVTRILCTAISDLSDLVANLNEEPSPARAGVS